MEKVAYAGLDVGALLAVATLAAYYPAIAKWIRRF
jgi:hypothetical protein